jgi:hypothetical protein
VELHRPLGNVQAIGNFFVGQVLEQPVEDVLFASAQLAGISPEPTPVRGTQNRIHEARKHLARDPKAAVRNRRQRPRELHASLVAIQDALRLAGATSGFPLLSAFPLRRVASPSGNDRGCFRRARQWPHVPRAHQRRTPRQEEPRRFANPMPTWNRAVSTRCAFRNSRPSAVTVIEVSHWFDQ